MFQNKLKRRVDQQELSIVVNVAQIPIYIDGREVWMFRDLFHDSRVFDDIWI